MAMWSHAAGRCDWTYVGYAGRNDVKRMVTEMPRHLENNILRYCYYCRKKELGNFRIVCCKYCPTCSSQVWFVYLEINLFDLWSKIETGLKVSRVVLQKSIYYIELDIFLLPSWGKKLVIEMIQNLENKSKGHLFGTLSVGSLHVTDLIVLRFVSLITIYSLI